MNEGQSLQGLICLQETHEAAAQGVVPEEHRATPLGTLRAVPLSFRIRAAHDTPLAGSKQVSCRARLPQMSCIQLGWRCGMLFSCV